MFIVTSVQLVEKQELGNRLMFNLNFKLFLVINTFITQ